MRIAVVVLVSWFLKLPASESPYPADGVVTLQTTLHSTNDTTRLVNGTLYNATELLRSRGNVNSTLYDSPELSRAIPKQRLDPASVFSLYRTLHITTALLRKHGIKHFASGGTLLGAIRNGGLIPHDNDVDLSLMYSDMPKLQTQAFQDDLAKNGLFFQLKYRDMLAAIVPEAMRGTNWTEYEYFVDIFGLFDPAPTGDRKEKRIGYPTGPNQWLLYPHDTMDHLEMHSFGQTSVPVPEGRRSLKLLDDVYPNWNTTVNCNGTHHDCALGSDVAWALHQRALPDGPFPAVL